jgi:hypothetical protein
MEMELTIANKCIAIQGVVQDFKEAKLAMMLQEFLK